MGTDVDDHIVRSKPRWQPILLGLDDNKLTYFHEGRYKQLSQTVCKVIEELIA